MRALAITGIVTASWMASISAGSLMRATPPSRRMSAGTRSSAITAAAPASSAMRACSAVTTSMITPPRNISASPRLTRAVPVLRSSAIPLPLALDGRNGCESRGRGRASGLGLLGAHRGADRGEVHPGAAGGELDRVAGRVGVGRGRGLRGLRPVALRHPPGREEPGVAGAGHGRLDDLGAGRVDVVEGVLGDELHDEVLGGDLGARGSHVGRAV